MQIDQLEYVNQPDQAMQAAGQLAAEPILGVDIETTGLDCHSDSIRLVSVATLAGRVTVFDLATAPVAALAELSRAKWIAYNAQFEQQHMTEAGFTMPPTLHDAMLLDRLWFNPKRYRRLDESAAAVLGVELDKALQTSDWSVALTPEQLEYAATDALAAVRIGFDLLPCIDKRGQGRLYRLWLDTSAVELLSNVVYSKLALGGFPAVDCAFINTVDELHAGNHISELPEST